MQEHQTFISSLLKIDSGQDSSLQAKKCRNIEPLLVRSWKLFFGIITHYKPRNAGPSNLYQFCFGPNSILKAKECRNIKQFASRNWCRKIKPLSSLHLKINLGPNSTLQDKEWRIIKPLSFCFQKLILGQISHDKPKNAGISNSLLLKIYLGPNSILQCRNIDI